MLVHVWEEYELGGELVQLVGSSFPCYELDGLLWLTSSQQEDFFFKMFKDSNNFESYQ